MKYTCHEDGLEFDDLEKLQRHLKSKTAWSNSSLVGCRVSVLLENREWSEGLVTQYHRASGKHCVEFRHSGARRWLVMLRTAFYIVDRCNSSWSEETKEPEGLATLGLREPWTFAEDLSLSYAKAQSALHACYGGRVQETGHKTLGHTCVTEEDKKQACASHGSLLYGELLPRGVNKALDARHLDAARASVLFDLGMGTGKVAMQAFLQFPNLRRVYGVELSAARYKVAERALAALADDDEREPDVKLLRRAPGDAMALTNPVTHQTLEIARGNLFHTRDVEAADILMLETEIPADAFGAFSALLDAARDGARVLTYLDLRKVWQLPGRPFPFRQLEANRSFADRYPTSWSVHRGHHLFLWLKVLKPSSLTHIHLNLNLDDHHHHHHRQTTTTTTTSSSISGSSGSSGGCAARRGDCDPSAVASSQRRALSTDTTPSGPSSLWSSPSSARGPATVSSSSSSSSSSAATTTSWAGGRATPSSSCSNSAPSSRVGAADATNAHLRHLSTNNGDNKRPSSATSSDARGTVTSSSSSSRYEPARPVRGSPKHRGGASAASSTTTTHPNGGGKSMRAPGTTAAAHGSRHLEESGCATKWGTGAAGHGARPSPGDARRASAAAASNRSSCVVS